MSDYIIHNIIFDVKPKLDFEEAEERDKPIKKYPNYYLGKVIGKRGQELNLWLRGDCPWIETASPNQNILTIRYMT